jgi:hypothetical protein
MLLLMLLVILLMILLMILHLPLAFLFMLLSPQPSLLSHRLLLLTSPPLLLPFLFHIVAKDSTVGSLADNVRIDWCGQRDLVGSSKRAFLLRRHVCAFQHS